MAHHFDPFVDDPSAPTLATTKATNQSAHSSTSSANHHSNGHSKTSNGHHHKPQSQQSKDEADFEGYFSAPVLPEGHHPRGVHSNGSTDAGGNDAPVWKQHRWGSKPPETDSDPVSNTSLTLATIPPSYVETTTVASNGHSGQTSVHSSMAGSFPTWSPIPPTSSTGGSSSHTRLDSDIYVNTRAAKDGSKFPEDFPADLMANVPPHVMALRPRGLSRSPADFPAIHNMSKLLPPLQIKTVKEIQEKDIPPPLKKNAIIPTKLPSEMLMPITLRCDFCQKFDSICSNCNRKWKGIIESRRAVLMNNIKSMMHIRKMGIYFGTILYGSQDFLTALLAAQPQLKNWCARLGPTIVPRGQPVDVQMKVADEKGRLFGLHVAMAFGKLESAKTLLKAGSPIRRSDSKHYPTEFLPEPIPDSWDDMLQAQQPYVEFRMAERARLLRRDGDFEGAALEYKALLALNPLNEHAYCGMAKMYFDQRQYARCLEECEKIIALERDGVMVPTETVTLTPSATPATSTQVSAAASPNKDSPAEGNTESISATPEVSISSPNSANGGAATATATASPSTIAGISSSSVSVTYTKGYIQWAEFALSTLQELERHARSKFHEQCHAEEGPALKACGCVVTAKSVIRIRQLPFKQVRAVMAFADCSTLWGWWRATKMPLLRNLLERSGSLLCDDSIGTMLSQEEGYSQMYDQIASDHPDTEAKRNLVLEAPLRFLGLQVTAMADFHTFLIRSSVAGTNPGYKERDNSVFFRKAREPMEKLKRAVAIKQFRVYRSGVGQKWQVAEVGEWEVDEAASHALQVAVQRKKEADERLGVKIS